MFEGNVDGGRRRKEKDEVSETDDKRTERNEDGHERGANAVERGENGLERPEHWLRDAIDEVESTELAKVNEASEISEVPDVRDPEQIHDWVNRAVREVIETEGGTDDVQERVERWTKELVKDILADEPVESGVTDGSIEDEVDRHPWEVHSQDRLDAALERYPDVRAGRDFDRLHEEAVEYYGLEDRDGVDVPDLVQEVEYREIRRAYEVVHDGASEVAIQSMKDVDDLLEKYIEHHLRESLSELDIKELDSEKLSKICRQLEPIVKESSRVFQMDLDKELELSEKELESFEQAFQKMDAYLEDNVVRYGVVDEKLYIWKPDTTPTRLENAYGHLYYYFRDEGTFDEYLKDVGKSLGLEGAEPDDILEHLRKLAPQMISEPTTDYCINPKLKRIRGDHVDLMNSVSGKTLSDLEGSISKITKPSGKGGIVNPKFPQGTELEVALARLTATAVTDCHLKQNGTLEYYEPEMSRIRIVEKNCQVFGDIKLNPMKRPGENLYVSYIPTPLGEILKHLDIPPGDKSVQNPSLFPEIKEFSPEAQCALIEDLVPQDGTISGKRIQWTFTNVLDAANKSEKFGFESRVSESEISLIKEEGKKEQYSWVLRYSKIKELRESENSEDRNTAENLWNIVQENPNQLIRDTIEIVGNLGIEYAEKPYSIRYHTRTGRVSVAWTAEPKGVYESIKLGMRAPPNDEVKRGIVKKLLDDHPHYVRNATKYFAENDIYLQDWWS